MSLCELCGQREANRGVIRRVDGVDQTTRYCDGCQAVAPRGHTAWAATASALVGGPRAWLPLALLLVLLVLAAAYWLLRGA